MPSDAESRSLVDERTEELYSILCAIAGRALRGQVPSATVSIHDIVHEAYVRIRTSPSAAAELRDRASFLAYAATTVRNVLVDRARARRALKRGGAWGKVYLEDCAADLRAGEPVDVLALDLALQKLALHHERMARVVELVRFGSMTKEEVAQTLSCPVQEVAKDLNLGGAWLHRELSPG